MIALVEALFFGSGSGIPLSQDVVTSNGGAWLSNATLRFFRLAEHCHTLKNMGGGTKLGEGAKNIDQVGRVVMGLFHFLVI